MPAVPVAFVFSDGRLVTAGRDRFVRRPWLTAACQIAKPPCHGAVDRLYQPGGWRMLNRPRAGGKSLYGRPGLRRMKIVLDDARRAGICDEPSRREARPCRSRGGVVMRLSARGLVWALLGLLVSSGLVGGTAGAQGSKCLAGKLKAIAKKEKGRLGCHAKAAASGSSATLAACQTKASTAFGAAMSKLTGCSGTTSDCEAQADSCTNSVRIALPDGSGGTGSSCEAARLKAAAKKASAKLRCYLKAATKGLPVDTSPGGCLDKANTKFTAAFNKVSGCTGDGDAASVESLIDSECVSQLVTVDGSNTVTGLCPPAATVSFSPAINQVDYYQDGVLTVSQSAWGEFAASYTPPSSLHWLNVVEDPSGSARWIVQNFPILSSADIGPGSADTSTYFDLGVPNGTPKGTINVGFVVSAIPATQPPTSAAQSASAARASGITPAAVAALPVGTSQAIINNGVPSGNVTLSLPTLNTVPWSRLDYASLMLNFHTGMPNVTQQRNWCGPGAATNSFHWLASGLAVNLGQTTLQSQTELAGYMMNGPICWGICFNAGTMTVENPRHPCLENAQCTNANFPSCSGTRTRSSCTVDTTDPTNGCPGTLCPNCCYNSGNWDDKEALGKLKFINAHPGLKPMEVHYTGGVMLPTMTNYVPADGTATNDGPITWAWIQDQMKKGQDVELMTNTHWVVMEGLVSWDGVHLILYRDDPYQHGTATTAGEQATINQRHVWTYFLDATKETNIAGVKEPLRAVLAESRSSTTTTTTGAPTTTTTSTTTTTTTSTTPSSTTTTASSSTSTTGAPPTTTTTGSLPSSTTTTASSSTSTTGAPPTTTTTGSLPSSTTTTPTTTSTTVTSSSSSSTTTPSTSTTGSSSSSSSASSSSSTSPSSSTTTTQPPTACCQFTTTPKGATCFDATPADAQVKCSFFGGTIVPGAVCDATTGTCGQTKNTGTVCCNCPDPTAGSFPHPTYCFESTAPADCGGCAVFMGAACGPLSESCGGP